MLKLINDFKLFCIKNFMKMGCTLNKKISERKKEFKVFYSNVKTSTF